MSSAICIYLWCTLEKAMAPHSSTLAWKIPWMEESDRLQSMGLLRVGHDWATSLSLFHFPALEKEMATHSSVFPGESQRRGSLVGSWWALDGVAQSRTRLKQLSSSSSMMYLQKLPCVLLRCVCVCFAVQFSSVQSLSHIWLFGTPWITACRASLSITNSRSSLWLMSIESVMPSSHLILCHPLLLLPPIPPSVLW